MAMDPPEGSSRRSNRPSIVLLPDPLGPTMAIDSPARIVTLTCESAGAEAPYAKLTSRSSMALAKRGSGRAPGLSGTSSGASSTS